jgi:hypothetical protein
VQQQPEQPSTTTPVPFITPAPTTAPTTTTTTATPIPSVAVSSGDSSVPVFRGGMTTTRQPNGPVPDSPLMDNNAGINNAGILPLQTDTNDQSLLFPKYPPFA